MWRKDWTMNWYKEWKIASDKIEQLQAWRKDWTMNWYKEWKIASDKIEQLQAENKELKSALRDALESSPDMVVQIQGLEEANSEIQRLETLLKNIINCESFSELDKHREKARKEVYG